LSAAVEQQLSAVTLLLFLLHLLLLLLRYCSAVE
jgi:hypothetical protein